MYEKTIQLSSSGRLSASFIAGSCVVLELSETERPMSLMDPPMSASPVLGLQVLDRQIYFGSGDEIPIPKLPRQALAALSVQPLFGVSLTEVHTLPLNSDCFC